VWLDPDFRSWNLEQYLPSIRCPTLLIQGEQDEYGTDRQIAAIARRVAGPVEVLLLRECGHSPHRDQRQLVLQAVVGFLEKHSNDHT
jgi:pimeloyl-ACP methyl ester carboxylesterase